MKYMGSKTKVAKSILPFLLAGRVPDQPYVEPFCGGCNVIDKVSGRRVASDSNSYLIAMWKSLQSGWVPPIIDRGTYNHLRRNPNEFPRDLVGWVGFNCSYSGKWFGGYAGETKTKINTVRNYQAEAHRNVLRQVEFLQGVEFHNCDYTDLPLPPNSIIYCDPPYANTTKYKDEFDHSRFWEWVRQISTQHVVFVSEYNAPSDFSCIWEGVVTSSLSANGKVGGNKFSTERLFQWSNPDARI